jgi:cold shock CspA family protein
MQTGKVKFYNEVKQFGFITPEGGDGSRANDVYFGPEVLLEYGLEMRGGDLVSFETRETPRGKRASLVRPL